MVVAALAVALAPFALVPNMPTPPRAAPEWARPAIGALLAAAVTLAPVEAALATSIDSAGPTMMLAGRSGGRVGGRVSAPRMAPRAAPRAAPVGGGRTNVYIAPTPMYGGYGMGYGGYGMGGGNGLGLYLGLSVAETFLREQQRQAYLQQQLRTQQQLGADQAAIQALQNELAAQNAKVEGLRAQQTGQQPGSLQQQAAPGETEATLQLRLQLLEQQKEIEALKAGAAAK